MDDAISVYRAALEELIRERAPLESAKVQVLIAMHSSDAAISRRVESAKW